MDDLAQRLTVVLLTHNCAAWLPQTLDRLSEIGIPVVAVDNASTDGTCELLAQRPFVQLRALKANIGAAGRNEGVRAVTTPYVAFCDDDGGGNGPASNGQSSCPTSTHGWRWSMPGSWSGLPTSPIPSR